MAHDRELHITWDDLDELAQKVHPDNPKLHHLPAIDQSFDRFGYVTPIVHNDGDDRIAAGHGRIEALLARRARGSSPPPGVRLGANGEWLVPTVHGINLSPDDAKAYLIADNRSTELGGWDEGRLASVLSELAASDSGLDGVGYSTADLSELLEQLGTLLPAHVDPDDVGEEPSDHDLYVEPGQLWLLGEQRLLNGDATRDADLDRLLAGRRADVAFTDPPYNVNLGNHGGRRRGRRSPVMANDALDAPAWEEFTRSWVRPLLNRVDGALYICMSSKEWPTVSRVLEEEGGHWSDTLIWAKDRFVLGRADYQRQYEPIWYGWREGSAHRWRGGRDQGDVWSIPRPSRSDLHPTMKPVALVERALENSSALGDIVLDPFLGSGTTLIAAERLGRRCFGIEIDPGYAQIVIERWQRLTGRRAVMEEAS